MRHGSDPLFPKTPIYPTISPTTEQEIGLEPSPSQSAVPASLKKAVTEGTCIPIIGHLFFPEEVTRRAALTPGPLQLANHLAAKCQYPILQDLQVAEEDRHWRALDVLSRVCTYYASGDACTEAGEPLDGIELRRDIQDIYRQSKVPSDFQRLARWRAVGIICTYFDGLLATEFGRPENSAVVAESPNEPFEQQNGVTSIVHLRGLSERPGSLVLTEHDNDQLLLRLARIGTATSNLVTGTFGRSLLFLGVSPRDPLVRHLGSALLNVDQGRDQVRVFFCTQERDQIDDCYWQQFGVTWIEADHSEVIRDLTSVAAGNDDA